MKELRSAAFSLSLSVVVFAATLPAARASAPAPVSGAVAGEVRTSDGRSLPGVAVELHGPRGRTRVVSGPDGGFRVASLQPGEYTASVDAPGLELQGPARVTVGSGEAQLALRLAPAPVHERVVVSATRGEATLSTLGVASDVIDRARIDERAAPELLSLLREVPGVATARAGGSGLQGSAFIRGGESRYARVLVDGVSVNQPGGAFDFGTALPFELERVEVVRGAVSSLYGSDALAGVVSLETRRARPGETPSLRAEAEGGSFGWQRFAGATAGARGRLDWNAGAQRLATDNEQRNGGFGQTSLALSSGLRLDSRSGARVVLRLDDGSVGTPGPTDFGRPDLDARFDRQDVVAGLTLRRAGGQVAHRVGLGFARTSQLSRNPEDSGSWTPSWEGSSGSFALSDFPDPAGFQNRTARLGASYQADLSAGSRHLLTAGVEAERQRGAIGDRAQPLLQPERTSLGLFVQDRVLVGSRAYLTLGGRVERNGSYGTRAVPRAALALRLRRGEDATTLRASAGLGIKEPSFLESYGESFFARGNPELKPERSTTIDAGVEQRLLGSRLRASVTAFRHDYRDQIAYTVIDYDTYEGSYVNLARTRSSGIELALEARPVPAVQLVGQYTLQDGVILESPSGFDAVYAAGQPLLRRPRHQASLSASYAFARGSVGATLVRVGERADSDFVGLGLTRNPGYTRIDLRARLRVAGPLEAFLVSDNLANTRYQEVLGYPALGRALRAGLRLGVGGRP